MMPTFDEIRKSGDFEEGDTVMLTEEGRLLFWCEGCEEYHGVDVRVPSKPRWYWNGDKKKPTLSPSVLCTSKFGPDRTDRRCHSFVTDGQIRYLEDCTHRLAGTTVNLREA